MALLEAVPALLFLALATLVGGRLRQLLLRSLVDGDNEKVPRSVARWVIALPVSFLVGTLLATWATYLTASALRNTTNPMLYANVVVIGVLAIAAVASVRRAGTPSAPIGDAPRTRWPDLAVLTIGLVLGTVIMFHTCRIEGDTLVMGRTAFGDLNIHLGMARSFSWGNNFPTGYMAYAGSDIRYHFMFYFLVGNLEFLGLPLDWAVNLPSILAFTSVVLLLHAVGSVVGRDARAGLLTVTFFLLRSSPAAFVYVSNLPGSFSEKVAALLRTSKFIGVTTHETWGIWNLNTYAVERHFGFAFGLVLIALLYLVRASGLDSGLPLLRAHFGKLRTRGSSRS